MEPLPTLTQLIDLSGKTAIVTGGAMGIGWGIAYRLAEAGAAVVIADMNEAAGREAAQKLGSMKWKAAFIQTDVSDEAQVASAVAFAQQSFGGLDILVNNAGIYPIAPMMQMELAQFEKILAVNLKSVFLFTKAAARVMKAGSVIVNVTSIDAVHPSSVGLAAYDASKHGLWGFTKNTALELAPRGIRVNAVAPGGIATPGTGAGKPQTPQMEEMSKQFAARIPLKRMGIPDDIGKAVLFLASDLAGYMTGAQVVVDGGVLLA